MVAAPHSVLLAKRSSDLVVQAARASAIASQSRNIPRRMKLSPGGVGSSGGIIRSGTSADKRLRGLTQNRRGVMSSNIRAVVYENALRVVERAAPQAEPGEALIRLRLAGICNTDLELMRGYKGFSGTLGHEFVGEVIDGPDAWLGKRVVGEINISCGECDLCRRGMRTHCRNRATLGLMNYDGAFADVFRLPVDNLWAVPDGVSDEQAVFAEPLAAACEVLEAGVIAPETRV